MAKCSMDHPFFQQQMKHCFPQLKLITIQTIFVVLTLVSIIIGIGGITNGKQLYFQKQEINLNESIAVSFNGKFKNDLNLYLIIPKYYQSTRLYIQSVTYWESFQSANAYNQVKDEDLLLRTRPIIFLNCSYTNKQNEVKQVEIDFDNILFKGDINNTAIFSKDFKENVDNSSQIINWWRTSAYSDVEKLIGKIKLNDTQNILHLDILGDIQIQLAQKQSNKAYLVLSESSILGSSKASYSISIICFIYAFMNICCILVLLFYQVKYGKESKKFNQKE